MMRLMLTHRDLMNLVRGTSPSFEAMDYPLVKSHFEYCDHPQRQWWNNLEKLSEGEDMKNQDWRVWMVIVCGVAGTMALGGLVVAWVWVKVAWPLLTAR